MKIKKIKTEQAAIKLIRHPWIFGKFIYRELDGNYLAIYNNPRKTKAELFKQRKKAIKFLESLEDKHDGRRIKKAKIF